MASHSPTQLKQSRKSLLKQRPTDANVTEIRAKALEWFELGMDLRVEETSDATHVIVTRSRVEPLSRVVLMLAITAVFTGFGYVGYLAASVGIAVALWIIALFVIGIETRDRKRSRFHMALTDEYLLIRYRQTFFWSPPVAVERHLVQEVQYSSQFYGAWGFVLDDDTAIAIKNASWPERKALCEMLSKRWSLPINANQLHQTIRNGGEFTRRGAL